MNNHPSLDIIGIDGSELNNKKIILCVTGSVAAYKAIELARLFMRHGADVTCVLSRAVEKLIRADYFKWATGNDTITKLTGNLEHIQVANYNTSDVIVVYPTTANTLGKFANGIDDSVISTILTTSFGSKIPIVMALAMHESMYNNDIIQKNIKYLSNKVKFVSPIISEGKAKIAEPEKVLKEVIKINRSEKLYKKKILISAGPTEEFIDDIRVVKNTSSGKTGILLAEELSRVGANVTLVYGPGEYDIPAGICVIPVKTAKQMNDTITSRVKKSDIVIMAAAISDYTPRKISGKLNSEKSEISVKLVKTAKTIDKIKKLKKSIFLVGFKAEIDVSVKKLQTSARNKLKQSSADLIIANDIGVKYKKDTSYNDILIIDKENVVKTGRKKKEEIVKIITRAIEDKI